MPHHSSARLVVLAVAATTLLAPPALAQRVRGSVRVAPDSSASGTSRDDSARGAPVPGATVFLVDSAGAPRASALTDDAGRFVLRAPAPGRYGVRVRRMGYAPLDAGEIRLDANASLTRTLALVPRAGTLPTVRAELLATCDRKGDRASGRAADAARYWHAARALLEGAAAAEGTGLLTVEAATWTRDSDARGVALHGRDATRSGRTARPFAAVEPARLASSGYARWGTDSASFFAPDATVLVSDAFAASHCVRLAPPSSDSAHAGAVGLEFAPLRARNVVDVRGTLWLDSTSGAPRDFRFAYVWPRGMVPDAVAARYGGEIAFAALPSGSVVVRQWELRVPLPVADRPSAVKEWGMRAVGASLRTVRSDAGALLARWERDGRLQPPLPATIAGTVFDSLRGAPVRGAQVLVARAATPPADGAGAGDAIDDAGDAGDRPLFMAATDEDGQWHVDTLPEGGYVVSVSAPSLDSIGVQLPEARVSVEGGDTARVAMYVPGTATLATLCGAPLGEGEGVVVGTVRDRRIARTASRRSRGTAVELSWGGARGVRGRVRAPVDAYGTYRACGVPRALPVRVRVLAADDVDLGQTALDGPREPIAAGDLTIGTGMVTLAANAGGAARLGAVRVTERADARPSLRDRIGGGGRALTFDKRVIADRAPSKLTDLLRTSPSLLVQNNGDVRPAIMDRVPSRRLESSTPAMPAPVNVDAEATPQDVSRPPALEAESANACTLRVVWNGKPYSGRLDDFPPSQVERVEVYLSAASMPAAFADSRAGCGVIVVWTDDGAAASRP